MTTRSGWAAWSCPWRRPGSGSHQGRRGSGARLARVGAEAGEAPRGRGEPLRRCWRWRTVDDDPQPEFHARRGTAGALGDASSPLPRADLRPQRHRVAAPARDAARRVRAAAHGHPRAGRLRQDDPGRAVAAGTGGRGCRRRVARAAPRRQRAALVPVAPARRRGPGAPGGGGHPRRPAGADRTERRGHPALHALGVAGARRAPRRPRRADRRRLAPDRRRLGAPGTGARAGLRAAEPVSAPRPAAPGPGLPLSPAAGAAAADRGRRRDAALRHRRDTRVPGRPERAAPCGATTSRGSPRAPTVGSRPCSSCRCRCATPRTRPR